MRKRSPESVERLRSSLLDSAKQVVSREGAKGLTMRALAAEAGCALGLPYKVFTDRTELVSQLMRAELDRLVEAGNELSARAGRESVATNLAWYAEQILGSPAVALAGEVMSDEHLAQRFAEDVHDSNTGPGDFQQAFARYLSAETKQGRVAKETDVEAVGFLLAGAVHNLVVSGPAYPRPSSERLSGHIAAVSRLIASTSPSND